MIGKSFLRNNLKVKYLLFIPLDNYQAFKTSIKCAHIFASFDIIT